jgi:inorganic pyrophosphatase
MDDRGRRRREAARGADRQGPEDLHALAEAEDINQMRLKAIQHFFEHYKDLEDGKWVKVKGWEGPDAAKAEITHRASRLREEQGD